MNDGPTDINGTLAVNEFAANGTAVGTLTAVDPDSGVFTWSFAAGGDAGGRFAINSATGAVTVANTLLLDFEQNISHNVTVHVVDDQGAPIAVDKVISVTVNNVDPENVTGDGTANTFVGGALADQLSGLGNDDILIGGGGNDTLTGGTATTPRLTTVRRGVENSGGAPFVNASAATRCQQRREPDADAADINGSGNALSPSRAIPATTASTAAATPIR